MSLTFLGLSISWYLLAKKHYIISAVLYYVIYTIVCYEFSNLHLCMPNDSDYIEQLERAGLPRDWIEQMERAGAPRHYIEEILRGDRPGTPPIIDEATKPKLLEDPVTGNRYIRCPKPDGSFEIQPYRSGIYDLPQELPVNYPNATSSVGVENGSVDSNIHELPAQLHPQELPAQPDPQELPVNYPYTSSVGVENGSISSTRLAGNNNTHNNVSSSSTSLNSNNTTESTTTSNIADNNPVSTIQESTNTSIRAVDGSTSTIQESANTSIRAVDGSTSTIQDREVVPFRYRFNVNDYPNNRHLSNSDISRIGANTNNNSQHEMSKDSILSKILSRLKSLDDKDNELNKSLKRRFY